jgi:serine/threonine protein kinase
MDKSLVPVAVIRNEVQMLKKLKHPRVVQLHEVYDDSGMVHLVMIRCLGGGLIHAMHAHWESRGSIPEAAICRLMKQLLESIAFLHGHSIVHRDVKADNLLMNQPDIAHEQVLLYLSDFGTATQVEPGERLQSPCGTKTYWAPEFHKRNYGLKVDIWACGIVFFGLWTGKFPFASADEVLSKRASLSKRAPMLPADLCKKLLIKEEQRRIDAESAYAHEWLQSVGCIEAPDPTHAPTEDDVDVTGHQPGDRRIRDTLAQCSKFKLGGKKNTSTAQANWNGFVVQPALESMAIFADVNVMFQQPWGFPFARQVSG